jgi:integrase
MSILKSKGKNKPKYVKGPYIDSRGELRAQFRRPGYPMHGVNLPLPIWSEAFMAVYTKAVSGERQNSEIGKGKSTPGSFSDLIAKYYQSPEFNNLAQITQRTYRNDMERFRVKHGDKRVAGLTTDHIERLIAEKADRPAAANRLRKTLKILMAFAVKKRFRADNPTVGVKKLKDRSSGFRTWNEEEIAEFYAAHPKGSRARLAMDLLLNTAQRRSDIVRMGRQHVRDGFLTIRQSKTGTEISIPVIGRFADVLNGIKHGHLTYLVTSQGKPFTGAGFTNWFREMVKEAGLPFGLAPHGLRKAACVRLADAGRSATDIMAISGHRNLAEVQTYVEAANRKRAAVAAMGSIAHLVPDDEKGTKIV